MWDICIIGGGAAGLSMALNAAGENPDAKIVIIEKNNQMGKKILATGNGRCNIGNLNGDDLAEVLIFFDSLGLMLKEEEEGRLYPRCEQATAVVEAFVRKLKKQGVTFMLNGEVLKVEKTEGHFTLTMKDGEPVLARRIGLTTGGKAAPQFGTTGDGFRFARDLGHRVEKLAPALMPVTCVEKMEKLKGVRAKGTATLLKKGSPMAIEKGEIQFTEDGLSGICIFNLSRLIKIDPGESLEEGFRSYSIMLDLVPELSEKKLANYLQQRQKLFLDEKGEVLLHSMLPDKLIPVVYESGLGKDLRSAGELEAEDLSQLAHTVKNLIFTVASGKGWKSAQCTAGGIPLDEINLDTMESRLVKGLFFGGEILDYDGPCGGYNLQHAWANGIKAGHNMVKGI